MSVLAFDCRFQYPAGFRLDIAFQTDGGVTALVGPSGIGKTTTLHLIAGLLRPAEGHIQLGDHVLFDSAAGVNVPIEARRIGVVFQDYQLFPHLTVDANLRYGRGRNPSAAVDLAHLTEVLELEPYLKRYPQSLSGGQKQRVALGRAIASDPQLLLMDEPVSALDASLKASVLEYVSRVIDEYQIPTLIVTHDTESAARLQAKTILVPAPSE